MADDEKGGFFGRIRGNAEWDGVKWAWSAVIAGGYWFQEKLRKIHVDWTGISILFALCVILCYLIWYWKKKYLEEHDEKIKLEAELADLRARMLPSYHQLSSAILAPERKYSRSEIMDMPADVLRKKMETERGFTEQLKEAAQPIKSK